jgi:hypothetical protein
MLPSSVEQNDWDHSDTSLFAEQRTANQSHHHAVFKQPAAD